MKNLSAGVAAHIAQSLGTEPVNIIEIQWVVDGNWLLYSDKEIPDVVDGNVLELSTLETVVKLDSQGQSSNISIKLSDHTGRLKELIDEHDMHGRLVRVYQWFETLNLDTRFELYEGEITSPIIWNEGDRTLSFSAITQLADKEAGYSPEEGNFPFLSDNLIGKAWPLVFGIVQNVPAVALFDAPLTQTAEDVGVIDPSLLEQLAKLEEQLDDIDGKLNTLIGALLTATNTCFNDPPDDPNTQAACAIMETIQGLLAEGGQLKAQLLAEKEELLAEYNRQRSEQNDTINVVDGSNFPQGTIINIQIGNILLSGVMEGSVFTIHGREVLDYNYNDGDDPFGFTFIKGGTTITLRSDTRLIYVVSIVPVTVQSVQTYRRVENADVLVIVPTNWYEVKETNIGSYTITYIEVTTPLSSRDETLQNDIYVNCTSTIGPNTVDIMEWLIDTYTNLSYDTTTFNYVKAKLENYPSHFALLERKNIIQLLEEMAFQSRCAIWVSNRIFYLRYLSEEQVEQDTITEDDIDAGSLEMFMTNTEELVTRLTATWTNNYAKTDKNKLILRHNIKKYGTRDREIDFYIYNLPQLVLKSATFWLIRLSNIWKNIKFNTYLHKLALETFDIVNFNFAQTFVANTAVKGMLTNVTYSSDENLMTVESWLPVKTGTMNVYIFTWPSQIDVTNLFPTNEEIAIGYAGGDGPGVDTEGEFAVDYQEHGFITIEGYRESGGRDHRLDYGDEVPSDLDDVKPTPNFAGTPFTAGDDPSRPYEYGDYNFAYSLQPPEEEAGASTVWPGSIISRIADHPSGTENYYDVAVYENGLENDPITRQVKQLQIAESEEEFPNEIPADTWVIVVANEVVYNDEAGNPLPPETEYTMQVPVWL